MNEWRISFSITKWLGWKWKLNGFSNPRRKFVSLGPIIPVQLFYEFYAQTRVGGKWLCAVVKYASNDAFVVTAYLANQLKAGETIWPKK